MFYLLLVRRWKIVLLLGLLITLSGCTFKKKQDPLEGINRGVFVLNKVVDTFVLRPVAVFYSRALPKPIQTGVGNFFQNLREIPNVANDILQWNWHNASNDAARFVLNTTLGIAGLFDVAAKGGLERHRVDFGETLAVWGYKESIYLVLPLFGPSTFRDGVGLGANIYLSVWPYIRPDYIAWNLFVLNQVDERAALLAVEPIFESIVGDEQDEYAFIRNAYLQHRQSQIEALGAKKTTSTGVEASETKQPALEGPPE
jgi:phospholipid-binding lipoprotein MlaA